MTFFVLSKLVVVRMMTIHCKEAEMWYPFKRSLGGPLISEVWQHADPIEALMWGDCDPTCLVVVMHDPLAPDGLKVYPLSECTPTFLRGDLRFNMRALTWSYEDHQGQFSGDYEIGCDARIVGEQGDRTGPAFIYNPAVPAHQHGYKLLLVQIRSGLVLVRPQGTRAVA